jgi:hypothetical protein
MAEFKVGLGAVLFAPKSRFIVTVGLQDRRLKEDRRVGIHE